MDSNMLKFIEIRNSYARPKIGELSINEKALAEYEKFCLDLIKDNEYQKEIIDKVRKIFEECKMLSPHEFNWEEQVDNALNILNEV